MDNAAVAARLLEHARGLDPRRRDNLYRVRAYRRAAAALALVPRPLAELLAEEGSAGLARLPGVGRQLARSVAALLATGEWHARDGDIPQGTHGLRIGNGCATRHNDPGPSESGKCRSPSS